jgi:hypothetical protein
MVILAVLAAVAEVGSLVLVERALVVKVTTVAQVWTPQPLRELLAAVVVQVRLVHLRLVVLVVLAETAQRITMTVWPQLTQVAAAEVAESWLVLVELVVADTVEVVEIHTEQTVLVVAVAVVVAARAVQAVLV